MTAGKVYTPSTKRSGVEGVMKIHILNLLHSLGLTLESGDYTVADVLAADEVFITNSVMELVPVKRIMKPDLSIDVCYDKSYTLSQMIKRVVKWRRN